MPSHGRLGRLDQQLARLAADGEPQEVEALDRGVTIRVLSSLKASPLGASHSARRALTCSACSLVVTQGDQIVGVSDQHRGARHRLAGVNAVELVADPGGLFHPVQARRSTARG